MENKKKNRKDKLKVPSPKSGLSEKAICLKFLNLLLQQPADPKEKEPVPEIEVVKDSSGGLQMSMGKSRLLPSSSHAFATQAYWNSFFEKERNGFEWYGKYEQLSYLLHKYMSEKDSVLIVGCGNSELSSSLHWAGIRKQVSIDISPVVIAQMQKDYPFLQYRQQDVTRLDYEDEHFSCILDKGTFDALTPPPSDDKEALNGSAFSPDSPPWKMLREMKRVLKPMGRFICISLLQPYIAEILFSFFHVEGWMIRVCRCHQAEEHNGKNSTDGTTFPVYMCVFTKMNLPGVAPIEYAGSADVNAKSLRLGSVEALADQLKEVLNVALLKKGMKTIGYCAEKGVSVDLCSTTGEHKYTTHTVDVPKLIKNPPEKQFGIFIVPQGRETEYMFGTHRGRTELAMQAGFARLVVIHFVRGQVYESMDHVKAEISDNILILRPASVEKGDVKCPIMTVGNELGNRKLVYEGKSAFSGNFVVEDVGCDEKEVRRLIFLESPNLIQSEVNLLKRTEPKGGKGKKKGGLKGGAETVTSVPNPLKITSEYHGIMGLSFALLKSFFKVEEAAMETLLIGLGGGILVSFLHHFLPNLKMTAVEIDPEIVTVGRDYFGLPKYGDDERLNVVVDDGLNYLKTTQSVFQVMMIDVDNKSVMEGLSCPPPQFLEPSALETMKSRLSPDGILTINLVCRNPALKRIYTQRLSSQFPFIYQYDIREDVNTVYFCFMRVPSGSSKGFQSTVLRGLSWWDEAQTDRTLPLQHSKKVKNGGGQDEVDLLRDQARLEIMSRNFKVIRPK